MLTPNSVPSPRRDSLYTISGKSIYFPDWQRPYEWDEENIEQTFDEIEAMLKDNEIYRNNSIDLGNIIVFEDVNKWFLADGRQRLTTYNLFFKVMKDIFVSKNEIEDADDFNVFPMYEETADGYSPIEFASAKKMLGQYKKNYHTIFSFVMNHINERDKIKKILLQKPIITINFAASEDDAYERFNEINLGGKPLTAEDMCRSYLTKFASSINDVFVLKQLEDNKKIKYYDYIRKYYRYVTDDESCAKLRITKLKKFLKEYIVSNTVDYHKFFSYMESCDEADHTVMGKIVNLLGRNQLTEMLYAKRMQGIDVDNYNYIKNDILPICTLSMLLSYGDMTSNGPIRPIFDKSYKLLKTDYQGISTKVLDYLITEVEKINTIHRSSAQLKDYMINHLESDSKNKNILECMFRLANLYTHTTNLNADSNVLFDQEFIKNNLDMFVELVKTQFSLGSNMIID